MHFDQVQPDTRVFCHTRGGGIAGKVLYKTDHGFGDGKPVVYIEFDQGGFGYNWAEQLSPLPGPVTAPKLTPYRAGTAHFYYAGQEYRIRNAYWLAPARWQVSRHPAHDGGAARNNRTDYVVTNAPTRKAAFAMALDKLTNPPQPAHAAVTASAQSAPSAGDIVRARARR